MKNFLLNCFVLLAFAGCVGEVKVPSKATNTGPQTGTPTPAAPAPPLPTATPAINQMVVDARSEKKSAEVLLIEHLTDTEVEIGPRLTAYVVGRKGQVMKATANVLEYEALAGIVTAADPNLGLEKELRIQRDKAVAMAAEQQRQIDEQREQLIMQRYELQQAAGALQNAAQQIEASNKEAAAACKIKRGMERQMGYLEGKNSELEKPRFCPPPPIAPAGEIWRGRLYVPEPILPLTPGPMGPILLPQPY